MNIQLLLAGVQLLLGLQVGQKRLRQARAVGIAGPKARLPAQPHTSAAAAPGAVPSRERLPRSCRPGLRLRTGVAARAGRRRRRLAKPAAGLLAAALAAQPRTLHLRPFLYLSPAFHRQINMHISLQKHYVLRPFVAVPAIPQECKCQSR